jgi:hypothetical protein
MSEEKGMKRLATIVALGALIPSLAAGVAQAALRLGNDKPNTFRGTLGDNKGQDTFFRLGAGDTLVGISAADQLAGGSDPDRLEGNGGKDTLDGGAGEDRIFTANSFDFVYARDGDRDVVNCNGQGNYRIVRPYRLRNCANGWSEPACTPSRSRSLAPQHHRFARNRRSAPARRCRRWSPWRPSGRRSNPG